MAVRSPTLAVALALIGPLGSGCASVAPTAVPASTSPTVTPGPTPAELLMVNGALLAGRYVYHGFELPMTFELDGTWTTTTQSSGYFNLISDPGGTILQVGRVEYVHAGPDSDVDPTTADAAVATIRTAMANNVLETHGATLGRRPGTEVTLSRAAEPGALRSYNIWAVYGVAPGTVGLGPGDQMSITFVDAPDGLIAITVSGSVADWDATLARAKPVVESIGFETSP
jgi:hypothetical protein